MAKDPYWIHIELEPVGDTTAGIELDLNHVTEVWMNRKKGRYEQVRIRYTGVQDLIKTKDGRMFNPDGMINLDNYAGQQFMEAWDKYRGKLQFETPIPDVSASILEIVRK